MTREEMIKWLKKLNTKPYSDFPYKPMNEALNMAIKELEQDANANQRNSNALNALEGDAISRQAVLEYIEGSDAELGHDSENELVCQDIKALPPVNPQSKTDVLGKIRAEIEQRKKNSGGEPNRDLAFNVCLQIIDKHINGEGKKDEI